MKTLNLLLCNRDTGITSALTQLHESRRSGVAMFDGTDFRLLTAADLAVARASGTQSLATVRTAFPVEQGQPVNVWVGTTATLTYQARLGHREVNILAPGKMSSSQLTSFVQSQLVPRTHTANWQIIGSAPAVGAALAPLRPAVLDDIVSGRFDVPLGDFWVSDHVWRLLAAPPRDYYCSGVPQHNEFPGAVRAGDPCPYVHNTPGVIVTSR